MMTTDERLAAIKKARLKLTNPLTCSRCGHVIERGAVLRWKRGVSPIRAFWHGECERRRRRKSTPVDAVSTPVETRLGKTSAAGRKRRAGKNPVRNFTPSALTKSDKRITLANGGIPA